MNGAMRSVVLPLALVVLASRCVTGRAPEAPVTSTAAPAAAAPTPGVRPAGPPANDQARVALDEGRKRLAQGDIVGASALLREALRLQPDLAEARASLGLALYAMGDLDAAVDELRGLLRVRPDLAEARLTLAAALVARQDWPAARAELESALSARPDLVQASYTLGVVRYAQGDLNGAIEAYRQVLAREPSAQDARYNMALVLKLARRDAEAAPEFLAAAQAGIPRAQYFAGAAYAAGAGVERDLVAAITWWMRAAELGVAQADESLAQLRQAASSRSRRPPAERQAIEQAFAEYRVRLWLYYPGVAREGDEPLGAALLRQGRAAEAVSVLIREAAALSEPAQRLLEALYDQGVDGQLAAHDARILAYLKSAAAEGRSRPRP